jgi:hypothetical protein
MMDDEKAASTTVENETPPVAEEPKPVKKARKKKDPSNSASNNVSSSGNGAANPKTIKSSAKSKEGAKSIEQLAEDYHEMVATAMDLGIKGIDVVKGFDSVKLGTQACERLHAQIESARNPERKAMRKSSKVRKGEKAPAKKAVASARGPRLKWEDDDKIVWTGKDIPFREGSEAHARVKVVQSHNGKTYKTYKTAIEKKLVKGTTLATCIKEGLVKKG